MEAELLPDRRTRLVLPRREDGIIGHSLLEALYGSPESGKDAVQHFRDVVGVWVSEAESLKDERSIIRRSLFGLPENMSEEDRERYERIMLREPRRTGTTWDELPKMEAELLSDGWIAHTLARGEIAILPTVWTWLSRTWERKGLSTVAQSS